MNFLSKIKEKAKLDKKTIVLPESFEPRVIKAAGEIIKEGIANIILIGNKDEIIKNAGNVDVSKAIFIDPKSYDKFDMLVDKFVELREAKGIDKAKAIDILSNDAIYFGVLLVKCEIADGMVAGAITSTADVLRPSLQIIKTAVGKKIVSGFFLMSVPNCEYGENGNFVFADCALNQDPSSEDLANIAKSAAESFEQLTGTQARIAFLSHSTKGSSKHAKVDKVTEAVKIAREQYPELILDGELQLDSAIIPEIARTKAPDSTLKGTANVLIFPDLDASNIGYKLVQRLAKADAYGPMTQGLAKPINDLSRGCNYSDVVGVVALTAVQAQIKG